MRTRIVWASLLTIMGASLANASPITTPPGLPIGSTYFLAFVTAGTSQPTSSDIADYDAFVTAQANLDPTLAALGTTWRVIGSTFDVAAHDHIIVGAENNPINLHPVFNLGGEILAGNVPELFDSQGPDHAIDRDQFGNTYSGLVWTGTLPDGSGATGPPDHTLGAPCDRTVSEGCLVEVGETLVFLGQMGNPFWLRAPIHSNDPMNQLPFYAISGPLEVVPEPSTISLMLGPLLLLRGMYRRRRHHRATPTTP